METLKQYDDGANVGFSILMRFTDATSELDHRVRKLIIVTCHVLREKKIRPSSASFLRAACSYLDLISLGAKPRSSRQKKPHTWSSCLELHARFEYLSAVIPKVPAAFLVKNQKKICQTITQVIDVAYSMAYLDAIHAGIRCIAQIVTTISSHPAATWFHIFETFELLLHRINHPKFSSDDIRAQGHLIVRDALQSFAAANPPLLRAASNELRDLFMKLHILCGSRSRYNGIGTFNLVITCIALMPREHKIDVFAYLKKFFELEMRNQNIKDVVMKGLHRVFRDNQSVLDDVPVELLLEPLCSICGYVSLHKDFHKVANVAGLLGLAVPKIYSLDKQICKAKLPIVFDVVLLLLDQPDGNHGIMLRGHLGVMFRCFIAYIDDSWIKLGFDNALKNANMDDWHQSQPTMIEKLCAGYHKFLACPFVRELAFPIVSDMLEKLGEYSSYLMRDTIKTLADMQKMPYETPFSKEQSKLLLKKVLKICGLDAIMAIIPQEHVELLVEINQQPDSITVCESPEEICGVEAFVPIIPQEHVELLGEVNQQLGSISVCESREGLITIDWEFSEVLYSDLKRDEYAHVTSVNKERRKAGETPLSGSELRAELDKVAKNRVKMAINERLEVAAKLMKRFKL